MWDMTNIFAYKFEHQRTQRTTYSEYYSGNCFKGGVFCQLFGLLGNSTLWGGGVSNTDYNSNEGYMKEQKLFQQMDCVFPDGNEVSMIVTFLNIFDRGYRAKMAAWLEGKQQTLQPLSAKSDERFRDRTTVYAANVAHDRSDNERAVTGCNRSGMMKRGFHPGMNPIIFNYVWRGWSFRDNFMYKSVP